MTHLEKHRPRIMLSEDRLRELGARAAERGFELWREDEPVAFADYSDDPTSKRQLFWLSYVSRALANLGPGRKVLDIGSNIAWVVGVAAHHDLTMVDVRVHPLRHILPFRLDQASVIDLPYPDASFDIVTFPQVLHWVGTGTYGDEINVDGDLEAVREIARVLRPGGTGVFSTFVVPNRTVMKIEGRRLFAIDDLKSMFAAVGLSASDLKICNAACEEIAEDRVPGISYRVLTPGNPDEDLAWAIGCLSREK